MIKPEDIVKGVYLTGVLPNQRIELIHIIRHGSNVAEITFKDSIAVQTREGEVWRYLFEKLETERHSLGGQVFDVLGEMTFGNKSLRELMIEAIRYGNVPERKTRLDQVVDDALDHLKLERLLQERALHSIALTRSNVQEIREDMDRAAARKLQPHFIAGFFLAAFRSP